MFLDAVKRAVTFARGGRRSPPEIGERLATTLASLTGLGAYNPDELVTRKGYAIYDQMQTDAQVTACLNVKKFAVLSKGWSVHPADRSVRATEVCDFIRYCMVEMRGSILDALYKVLDAVAKGFSVCEINWKLFEDGPYAGMVGIDTIKSKDPSGISFDVDEFLNVRGVGSWRTDSFGKGVSRNNGQKWGLSRPVPICREAQRVDCPHFSSLPPEKFVIYTYMPRYEDPHGQSDLRAAYKHWWSKDFILRFYNTYLEKYGCPVAKGSYRKGTTKQQQDDLLKVLDRIQQETAIVVPEDVTVELLEATRGGEAGYVEALEYHDRQIAKAILGQSLATELGKQTGSYAQAKVHLEVMRYHLEKLKRDLEESVVGEQIIRRLVDYNFPKGSEGFNGSEGSEGIRYPRFSLGPLEDRDLLEIGGLIAKLIDGQVISPDEPWIREYLGLPGREGSEGFDGFEGSEGPKAGRGKESVE